MFLPPGWLNCVAFEKAHKKYVALEKTQLNSKLLGFRVSGYTPKNTPGRPKPFRAQVEYWNQPNFTIKLKADFFPMFLPRGA